MKHSLFKSQKAKSLSVTKVCLFACVWVWLNFRGKIQDCIWPNCQLETRVISHKKQVQPTVTFSIMTVNNFPQWVYIVLYTEIFSYTSDGVHQKRLLPRERAGPQSQPFFHCNMTEDH